ncbi:MAG: PCYCGC motif-containing (lipo)protein, partial [Vicinamibacterales bacterium]
PARKTTTAPARKAAAPARVLTPPIPTPGFAPARPVDVTRAVYDFAAQHPEVLKYVPCYCGCESSGHPHNESCFVKTRDAKGNVTGWDTHGYG